jgi:hypothetical protein
LSAHLLTLFFFSAPVGALLHFLPRHARKAAGVSVAMFAAVVAPLIVACVRHTHPEAMTWMVAFLINTWGFSCFFKSLAVAMGTFPEGADTNLSTWLLWYTSLPEPRFAKGKLLYVPRAFTHRAKLALLKVGALFCVLTAALSASTRLRAGSPAIMHVLVPLVHLWLVYLWAAFCLDFSALLVILCGGSTDPGFRNPLLESRSVKEAWGERWNLPVQLFLKRSVYVPARNAGRSRVQAVLLTFFSSGLLHEYNFSMHNYTAYQPGCATAFFLAMGVMVVFEDWLSHLNLPRARSALQALPTVVIALAIQCVVTPLFSLLFMRSWLGAGMVEAVGELMPHVRC